MQYPVVCSEFPAESDLVDRVDRNDRWDMVGLGDFVRDAVLPDCGILFCGGDIYVCTASANRLTGADRAYPEYIFERTDRVEILVGVNGERSPETRGHLDSTRLLAPGTFTVRRKKR